MSGSRGSDNTSEVVINEENEKAAELAKTAKNMFKKIGKNALMGDFTSLIISKEQSISTPNAGA